MTVVSAPSVTTHVPVPEQPPPDQPVNVEFASGVAVSVTAVEFANVVEQVAPQVMPAGALETEPVPGAGLRDGEVAEHLEVRGDGRVRGQVDHARAGARSSRRRTSR